MLKTVPVKVIVAAALVLLVLLTVSMRITAEERARIIKADDDTKGSAEALADAKYSWARDDIEALAGLGAVIGYPDGSFKPNQAISRAELATMLARSLDLGKLDVEVKAAGDAPEMPYTDMKDHWAEEAVAALYSQGLVGFADGETFEPDAKVTRSEILETLMSVIPVEEKFGTLLETVDSSFIDLTADDELFAEVEAAERLGIIPIHYGVAFEPNNTVTRAEAASMINKLINIEVIEGMITSTDSASTITVAAEGAKESQVSVSTDTLTVRNGLATRPNTLKQGDLVYVVASDNSARFIHSFGELTQEDLLTRATSALKGLLTQEEVAALVRGDYELVQQQVAPKLRDRLVGEGLSEQEADALVQQNWGQVPSLLQERAISSISQELGVPAKLITDTVQQKWDSVQSYAEQKLTEYVIATLIKSDVLAEPGTGSTGSASSTSSAGSSASARSSSKSSDGLAS